MLKYVNLYNLPYIFPNVAPFEGVKTCKCGKLPCYCSPTFPTYVGNRQFSQVYCSQFCFDCNFYVLKSSTGGFTNSGFISRTVSLGLQGLTFKTADMFCPDSKFLNIQIKSLLGIETGPTMLANVSFKSYERLKLTSALFKNKTTLI